MQICAIKLSYWYKNSPPWIGGPKRGVLIDRFIVALVFVRIYQAPNN